MSEKADFPYIIFHFSFFIEENTSSSQALLSMKNEKWEMGNGKS
jgi:hypothetical protein